MTPDLARMRAARPCGYHTGLAPSALANATTCDSCARLVWEACQPRATCCGYLGHAARTCWCAVCAPEGASVCGGAREATSVERGFVRVGTVADDEQGA